MAKTKQAADAAPVDPAPVAENTSTGEIQIQGHTFTYSTPYVAGACTLSEGEANQLNSVRGENLRNNFASKVKDAKAEAVKARGEGAELTEEEIAGLVSEFASYDSQYQFAGKRISRGPADPVKAKARKMARETIEGALRAKNIKPSELADGKMDELIDKYLDAHPEVTEEARAQVEKIKAEASAALEGVDLDSLKAPAQAPATEASGNPAA